LAAHSEVGRLRVEGHTDALGSFENNLVVSKKRAKVVVDWLTAHGVASDRLESQGYASAMPLADNETPDGRARNRRIELHIVERPSRSSSP
jgi:outer membrane protein OmpA-like peptidoglycan-associated protein